MPDPVTPPAASASAADIAAEVRSELQKIMSGSDWRARMEDTVRQNVRLKKKLANIPKLEDGGRVLSKAEAEKFDAFVALKIEPKDVEKLRTDFTTLQAKETERSEEEQYDDAAEALGWGNRKTLVRFLKRENLELSFKDVREKGEDGKTTTKRVPFVRAKGDEKAAPVALDEYVENEMGTEFVDILKKSDKPDGEQDEDETETGGERTTARRIAGLTAGVEIAETPGARQIPSGKGSTDKKLKEIEDAARNSGMYSM
jgi:hypothetical protein